MNPRNQFHPRNQLLFITAASNEIIIIIIIIIITIIIYVFIAITYCSSFFIAIIYCSSSGHRFFSQLYGIYSANCVVYTILVLVSTQPLRATSCYPSQRSPRNQLLFCCCCSLPLSAALCCCSLLAARIQGPFRIQHPARIQDDCRVWFRTPSDGTSLD